MQKNFTLSVLNIIQPKKVIVMDLQNGTEMTGLSKIMKRVVSQEVSLIWTK